MQPSQAVHFPQAYKEDVEKNIKTLIPELYEGVQNNKKTLEKILALMFKMPLDPEMLKSIQASVQIDFSQNVLGTRIVQLHETYNQPGLFAMAKSSSENARLAATRA